jgi:RHS repeat-associated protein
VTSAADVNGNVTVKARYDYLPFGEEIGSDQGSRSLVTGYVTTDKTRQKFTQKERDSESGLDYFLARYYSSAQGRFTSPDPKPRSAHRVNPQSWSRYTYTLNNPLKYIDPDGMDVILAEGMSQANRIYVVKNLARMYATPAGKAMLQRADESKFTITVGTGHLGRTELTKAPPGTVVMGGQTIVEGGNTRYNTSPVDGHKVLQAKSPDSPTAAPIQVIIDKDQSAEIGKDPAKVLAHELGGHTAEVLNAAESNPAQFVDGVKPKDETASEAAEKALGKVPNNPTPQDIQAVEELLKPKPPKKEDQK